MIAFQKEVFGWNGDAYNLIKNLNNQVVSMFQTRYFWFWKKENQHVWQPFGVKNEIYMWT